MIIKTQPSPSADSRATTPEATAAEQPRAGQIVGAGAARLGPHPLSLIFPELEGKANTDFVDDIRRHGVLEPITLFEGKILDGRNRYRASIDAGVGCPTTEYSGDDPLGFVISLNLKRRHLNDSQRSMVASKIADLDKGQRQIGQLAHVPTQGEAAKILNVSSRSVKRAKFVRERGTPELVAATVAGNVSVAAAESAAQLPEAEQREAVAKGKEGVRAAAKKARSEKQVRNRPKQTDLMLTELHHLAGHCKDIPAERLLAALQKEPRRLGALSSMRIVHDWAASALSSNSEEPSASPSEPKA